LYNRIPVIWCSCIPKIVVSLGAALLGAGNPLGVLKVTGSYINVRLSRSIRAVVLLIALFRSRSIAKSVVLLPVVTSLGPRCCRKLCHLRISRGLCRQSLRDPPGVSRFEIVASGNLESTSCLPGPSYSFRNNVVSKGLRSVRFKFCWDH